MTKRNDKVLIVFDFFGVISSEVSPIWLSRFFDDDTAKKIKDDIVGKADTGEIDFYEMLDMLSIKTNVPSSQILKDWLEIYKIDKNVVNLIKKLKQKYKVAILSNGMSEYLDLIFKNEKLENIYDEIVVSSVVKIAKPDIRIYNILLNKFKEKFEKVIFIDDNPANVATGKKANMISILYTGYENLVISLKNLLDISY